MMVFLITWSIWFASEILLNRLMRSGSGDKKGQDKGSILVVWSMIALAISSGIVFSFIFNFPVSNLALIPYLGLVIIIAGMILRFIAVWTLGRLFTVDVTIRDDHQIQQKGVYRFIRHPSYSGSLLSFIGFGLSLNNWFSLISVTIIMAIALLYRIKIEEKILTDQFGTAYLDYKKNTCRLIPWIY